MVERRREIERVEGNEDSAPGSKHRDEDNVSFIQGERRESGNQCGDKVENIDGSEVEEDDDSDFAVDMFEDNDCDDDDDDDGDIKTDSACASNALALADQKPSDARPSFGNIVVKQSSDVHFGNRTFYNGPVTIKQFVYTTKDGSDCHLGDKIGESHAEVEKVIEPVVVSNGFSNEKVPIKTQVSENPSVTTDLSPNSENPPRVNGSLLPIWQPSRSDNGTLPDRKTEISQWMRKVVRTRRCLMIIATVCTCAFLLLVTLIVVLNSRSHDTPGTSVRTSDNSEEDKGISSEFKYKGTDNVPSGKLKVISRREWLAQPPVKQGSPLQHPMPYVVILHTATENCSTQAACIYFVRHTQTFHIESNGWWDIGYSFLVGGDGSVYVGRGWDTEGAFAFGYNNRSIGIAFIGTFIESLPPPKQILAGQLLIAQGVEQGKLSPDYKLFAHRQLSATESPGLAFFENIKTWSHWAEKP